MIWGDLRVDAWFYAVLVVDFVATCLIFARSARLGLLQLSLLANFLLWIAYERAIGDFLSAAVPIRVDFPFVVLLAFYPVIPLWIVARRGRV